MAHFIVVGGGQAGASLVAKLRNSGFQGQITLIGAEPVVPYERPPLSKAYLLGEMAMERLFLRPESFYQDHDITLKLGAVVQAIDPAARQVTLEGGEVLSYDGLALCTGSHPRKLPAAIGGDLENVFVVRTLADVDAMEPTVREGARALIVGGGYIGLEAAAVAAKKGMKVTLVEMADRILQRVAAPETSDFFRKLHRDHGVEIREGVGLETLLGEGSVTGAKLSDGSEIAVDMVVAGVGIVPATELAEAAGLDIDNGIKTDARGRTSDPRIWAAGDCTSFPYRGGRIRLESVPNAIDQAEVVAQNMMGGDVEYVAKPWFWSDQYDCKLQIAGLNKGYDHVETRHGEDGRLSFWYFHGDELVAVDAMNDARGYMVAKRLIESGKTITPEQVHTPDKDMKKLLKA